MFTNLNASIRAAICKIGKAGNPGSRNLTRNPFSKRRFRRYFGKMFYNVNTEVYAAWDIQTFHSRLKTIQATQTIKCWPSRHFYQLVYWLSDIITYRYISQQKLKYQRDPNLESLASVPNRTINLHTYVLHHEVVHVKPVQEFTWTCLDLFKKRNSYRHILLWATIYSKNKILSNNGLLSFINNLIWLLAVFF